MKPAWRLRVSLVTETGMLLWISSPLMRGGLMSVVFGSSLLLLPLVSGGGGLVCESVGKADLLSDHFDSKQYREAVDLLFTFRLCLQVERGQASLVRLRPLWRHWPIGYVSSFLKRTALDIAHCLSVVFRKGSLPACWGQANATPIPKGPPSSSVVNYGLISLTSVLSKMFECLVLVRLGQFMECSDVLPTTNLVNGKVWVPLMHFCACAINCKVHWRVGRRVGLGKSISMQPLIGSAIRAFNVTIHLHW